MKQNGYLSRRLAELPTSRRLMHPRADMTVGDTNRLTRSPHNLRMVGAELVHKPHSTCLSHFGFDPVFGFQLLQKLGWLQAHIQNSGLPFNG